MPHIAEGFLLNNFVEKEKYKNEREKQITTIEIISFDCIIKNLKILPKSISLSLVWEERKFFDVSSTIFYSIFRN